MDRHTRRLLDSLVVAMGQRTAIGTRNLHNWSLPAATPPRSSSRGCLSDSSGYHASPCDPLRAATRGCASTSLRGDHRAQSGAVASDHFRSASSVNCVASRCDRNHLVQGYCAANVSILNSKQAFHKSEQLAKLKSPSTRHDASTRSGHPHVSLNTFSGIPTFHRAYAQPNPSCDGCAGHLHPTP